MTSDGNPRNGTAPDAAMAAGGVRTWDPTLELLEAATLGRLYEPDGTLYAIALEPTTLATDRRRQAVGRGDLVVVPQAVAVDLDPEGAFLGLLDFGPPPYHFRERFIQVWGFEHAALPDGASDGRPAVVLHDEPARHRVSYHAVRLGPGETSIEGAPDTATLAVVLDGDATLRAAETAGTIVLLAPGGRAAASGPGLVGLLGLSTDLAHQARRAALARAGSGTLSPELTPAHEAKSKPKTC